MARITSVALRFALSAQTPSCSKSFCLSSKLALDNILASVYTITRLIDKGDQADANESATR